VFAAARDVTERKRLDRVLQEKNVELEEARRIADQASRTKSDFVANVSHEIRTPMNAIIGFADLALKTELNPKQADYLKKIHLSGRTLLGIINDILDFSKIEAGKLTMERIDFSLTNIVSTIVSMIGPEAAAKNVNVIVNVPTDVPTPLIGDPLRLSQVLTNLMSNAIKFTDHGEIEVNVSNRKLEDPSAIELRFVVRDTGIGSIPSTCPDSFGHLPRGCFHHQKIWRNGLGLSISKRLVELMVGISALKASWAKEPRFPSPPSSIMVRKHG